MFIDIHISRLSEWLQKRKICNDVQTWKKHIECIKKRIGELLRDVSDDNKAIKLIIENSIESSYMNYFDCEDIFDVLKSTESADKTLFGSYVSPKLKEWDSLLRDYKKNNSHIAEASFILFNGLHFLIPSLNKQLQQTSSKLKLTESLLCNLKKSNVSTINTIQQQLSELNIDNEACFADAILQLTLDLSVQSLSIGKNAQLIEDAYKYYQQFVNQFHGRSQSDCMKSLQFLIEKGNTTVYEFRYGRAPETLERPVFSLSMVDDELIDNNDESEIDWGDDTTSVEHTCEAMHDEALTILEHRETRELIYQAVCQISAFYGQRVISCQEDYDYITDQIIYDDSEIFIPTEVIQKYYNDILSFNDLLSNPKFVQLCAIWDSPRKLQSKYNLINRKRADLQLFNEQQQILETDINQLTKTSQSLTKRISMLSRKLQSLLDKLCAAIEQLSSDQTTVTIAGCGQLMNVQC